MTACHEVKVSELIMYHELKMKSRIRYQESK